jgi:hypothetical protein
MDPMLAHHPHPSLLPHSPMSRDLLLILGILVAFPIFFFVLWRFVAAILSAAGGWGALAERYPAPPTPEGKAYPSNSGFLQRWFLPVNYNFILTVRVGDSGVGLETNPLFRFNHPPLLIPWHAVRECRRFSFLFFTGAHFRVAEPGVRIAISGPAGEAILERWTQMQGVAGSPQPVIA